MCARNRKFSNNKPRQNNSELVSQTADKVTLKATKKIKNKSEIFTAYGPTYFKRPNSDPKPVFATSKSKIKHETPLVSPKGCMAPPGSEKVPPKKRKRKWEKKKRMVYLEPIANLRARCQANKKVLTYCKTVALNDLPKIVSYRAQCKMPIYDQQMNGTCTTNTVCNHVRNSG